MTTKLPHKCKLFSAEQGYLELLKDIIDNGVKIDRKDITPYYEIHGATIRHDMSGNLFPLLTTKSMPFEKIKQEFIWMYNGNTNVKGLHEHGIRYWDGWADENGELGPVYGKQFRDANGVDQIERVIQGLIKEPNRRRHMIDLFNAGDLDDMSLPPCVFAYQFLHENGNLDIIVYQRSADVFLGLPFDIAQSALLLKEIALKTGLKPRYMTMLIGSAHLYENHLTQAKEQITRKPYLEPYLHGDKLENLVVYGYNRHERLNGELTHIPKEVE